MINSDEINYSSDLTQNLRKSWRKAMHLSYMFTHPKHEHNSECLFCKQNNCHKINDAELKFLESASKNTEQDIRALSLFCLGTYFTTLKVKDDSLQQGVNYLKQSAELSNKDASQYLAGIYAGAHKHSFLQSFGNENTAINLYLKSFSHGNYEALEELMSYLRNGQAKYITKNISYWQELFSELFIRESKANNTENVHSLIKCLIRQTKETSEEDTSLLRIIDILKSWRNSKKWNNKYSTTASEYIRQEICENNKKALYLNNVLEFIPKDGMKLMPGIFWTGNALFREGTKQKNDANLNKDIDQKYTDDKTDEKNYFNFIILKNSLINEKESLEKTLLMLEQRDIDTMTFFSLALNKINKFTEILNEYITLNKPQISTQKISLTEITESLHEKIKSDCEIKNPSTKEEIKKLLLSLNDKLAEYLNIIIQIDCRYDSLNIKSLVLSSLQNIKILVSKLTEFYNESSCDHTITNNQF